MEILRFTLSGKNAFFKKPEVNTYCYFTYGNIHKVALLGVFGAILGHKGYAQMQNILDIKKKKKIELEKSYPDFYNELKDLKISILPLDKERKGLIAKKVQTFNNSVGYASGEQGGNLIVKEQWLENPAWEICLLIDSPMAEKLKESITNHKCIFYPYLGKNDHLADITNISVEEAVENKNDKFIMDCFVPKDMFSVYEEDESETVIFKYEEAFPYEIDPYTNNYIFKRFIRTNNFLEKETEVAIYTLKDKKNIIFY